jgi:threonine synthase
MLKPKFASYRCSLCGTDYDSGEAIYNCRACGGNLDIRLDYDSLRRGLDPREILHSPIPSLWRYLPLLPVSSPGGFETPLGSAGFTPVFALPALAAQLSLRHFRVKDESRNPTASFKDRASAVVVARAREVGAQVIVTASSGNAGAALAGMAAAAEMRAVILVPRTAPPAKVAQLLIFGAQVFLVDGTYDDAFDLSLQAAQEFGWYSRNTGFNPFTAEGKKTAAFEIWEWWQAAKAGNPALAGRRLSVFVAVGDGNIISGIQKGFKDLAALGWLDDAPRLFGVQAEGANSVYRAFAAGSEQVLPVQADTLADSIAVGLPRDGVRAVRAALETGGAYLSVTDEEILRAIPALGRAGVFAEPAGAAAQAGLEKALRLGWFQPDDPVLVINTGSGLKDVAAARRATNDAAIIEPSLRALKRVLGL